MPKLRLVERDPITRYLEEPIAGYKSTYREIELTDAEVAEYDRVMREFDEMQVLIDRKYAERRRGER